MENKTKISAIAIISKDRGLGKDNHLLFHIPGELPRLKSITMGHPIIMGRKTFNSIGTKALPGRLNVVVTRMSSHPIENVTFVSSVKEAIKVAQESEDVRIKERGSLKEVPNTKYQILNTDPEVFILGGGQIFAEALPMTDRLYLTIVDTEVPADTFFPDYSEFTKIIEKEEKNDWEYPYQFLTLEREK